MKKSYRKILKGMGSIINIMPSNDYSRFVPKETDEERMRATWQQVGDDLRQAMGQYSSEQAHKEVST